MSEPRHLLILGGTAEGAALARAALARFGEAMAVTTALAGGSERPGPIAGDVRIGGFGGAAGLAAYLAGRGVDRLVDATHPFASRISNSARLACEGAAVPRLLLLRPPSPRHPLDRWIEVDTVENAAAIVGRVGRRAWLTVGADSLAAFARATETRFVVRLPAAPRAKPPLRYCEILVGRGPFSLVEERHLLQRHAVDVVVCTASGGAASAAKLAAARELSLPVIMVRRPPIEPGPAVDTVEDALAWLVGLPRQPEAKRMS